MKRTLLEQAAAEYAQRIKYAEIARKNNTELAAKYEDYAFDSIEGVQVSLLYGTLWVYCDDKTYPKVRKKFDAKPEIDYISPSSETEGNVFLKVPGHKDVSIKLNTKNLSKFLDKDCKISIKTCETWEVSCEVQEV